MRYSSLAHAFSPIASRSIPRPSWNQSPFLHLLLLHQFLSGIQKPIVPSILESTLIDLLLRLSVYIRISDVPKFIIDLH